MNARYYLPAIGRFLSADTLIPDPVIPVKTGTTPNPSTATAMSPTTPSASPTPQGILVLLLLTLMRVGIADWLRGIFCVQQ